MAEVLESTINSHAHRMLEVSKKETTMLNERGEPLVDALFRPLEDSLGSQRTMLTP